MAGCIFCDLSPSFLSHQPRLLPLPTIHFVSVVIPWSTCNSQHRAGLFTPLCLSVHTSPSGWTALCPPSTCKALLILPDPTHMSHALWNLWSLFYLLNPRAPPIYPPAFSSVTSMWHRIHRLHRFKLFIIEVCLLRCTVSSMRMVMGVTPLHRPASSSEPALTRGDEHKWPVKGVFGLFIEMEMDTLFKTVSNDNSSF